MTSDSLENHEPDSMDESQVREAKAYSHQQLVCDLLDRGLDIAFLALATFVLARPLDAYLATYPALQSMWLRLLPMFAMVTLLHMAVSFPLSLYAGHFLEQRFGLSSQTLGKWLWRYLKRNALALLFGLVLVPALYGIIWWTGSWWWLVAAGAFFVVSIILGQLAPVLILPLFYKITRLDSPTLAERFRHLSDGTGLSIEGVYRMEMSAETSKANAMLAGLGSTRRVILGDTLLDGFDEDEIEVIFAHEVGHHVHRHIWKLIALGILFSASGFYVCDRLISAWVAGLDGSVDYHRFPVYTLPALMLATTIFSQLVEPIQNVISRYFERQCDWYALEQTRMLDAYRSAFRKLAKLNKADPNPHPVEVFLFHSHPPIAERIGMADQFSERRGFDAV